MDIWLIIFIVVISTISLVESGCHHFNPFTKGLEELCDKWWVKARGQKASGSEKKSCINLIKEKCPKFIDSTTTIITRSYDVDKRHYETWTYRVEVTHESDPNYRYYYYYKSKPICWDDNGKVSDCDYWWQVARNDKVKDEYKERCIERILDHCKGKLTPDGEVDNGVVKRNFRSYKVKKSKPICWDDNGKESDCDYWWQVARSR